MTLVDFLLDGMSGGFGISHSLVPDAISDETSTYHKGMGPGIAVVVCAAHMMDHTQVIAELQAELEMQKQQVALLNNELKRRERDLAEARQRLELRNLSLERLQSQFTLAADAVNKLLAEREKIRQCRWAKLGIALGLLPKLEDDLR
jgi:hypothetical protein